MAISKLGNSGGASQRGEPWLAHLGSVWTEESGVPAVMRRPFLCVQALSASLRNDAAGWLPRRR